MIKVIFKFAVFLYLIHGTCTVYLDIVMCVHVQIQCILHEYTCIMCINILI